MNLDRYLEKSATFSESIARYCCTGGHLEGEKCNWYHGAWQYLRLLDMVSAPVWHREFFENAVESAIEDDSNILISGTADYTMLAVILDGLDASSSDAQVDVLDSCPTPIMLCEWYAARHDVDIGTIIQDIRDANINDYEYDLIVSDAFLTRFPSKEKSEVLNQWQSLLSSSGQVATTIRIEPEVDEKVGSEADEVRSFSERAHDNVQDREEFPIDAIHTTELAKAYAENIVSYPIQSESKGAELFTAQDFSNAETETNVVKGEMSETTYCQVIAEK